MAGFKSAPYWDVKYKRTRGRKRLEDQLKPGGDSMVYMSNYDNTLEFLTKSRALNRELYRGASRLMRTLKGEIGRDEGTGGYHLQDVVQMRRIRYGGKDKDRQAYHIFVVNASPDPNNPGHAFLAAERQSQFSKEAWRERQKTGRKTPPNRSGWVDSSLNRVSRGRKTRRGN